jgi:hypothetical protein
MNGALRNVAVGVMAMAMALSPAAAAEKTYEKPSDFLKRHFGDVPKTRVLELDRRQQGGIKAVLGHDYGQTRIRYWKEGGKTAWILEEIGKTEPITTGFIIRNGAISEIKVLIYRESHGWEVSRPFFTRQFVGAKLAGGRLERDIDGIVGATLSVRALTRLSAAALYLSQQVDS